jgi:hypothetical protein
LRTLFGRGGSCRLAAIELQGNLALASRQGVGALLPQGEGGGAKHARLNVLLGVVMLDVVLDHGPDFLLFEQLAGGGDVWRHVAILVPGRHHAAHQLVHLAVNAWMQST